MFLVRYFRDSFNFKKVLPLRKEPFWKILIYFIIIATISLFSFNFTNLRVGGWKLGFVEANFLSVENLNVKLPDQISIGPLGLRSRTNENQIVIYKDSKAGDIIFYFLVDGDIKDVSSETRQMVFTKDTVYYFKGDTTVIVGDYNGFNTEVRFEEINIERDNKLRNEMLSSLANNIEKSFGKQNAFYTIVNYSVIQIAMYIVLILILAAVLQLFRFGYVQFMSYFEGIKIVVLTMTIPSILAFIVGFFTHAFGPIIIQFGIGIILMVIMLKYAKHEFSA